MINRICLAIFSALPLISYCGEEKQTVDPHQIHLDQQYFSEALLLAASHRYLDFINKISQGELFPQGEEAASLLASDCKKVLNGQRYTQTREEFVADLLSVYASQGSWKVCPADIIVAPSSHSVVLRLIIEMEQACTYTAIVILRYNSDYLITEINEVLNQVKGAYDFTEDDK